MKKPFLARTKMKDKRFFGTCGKKERVCLDKIFRNKRLAVKSWMGLFLTPVSYTHLDVYKRQGGVLYAISEGVQSGPSFLLLAFIF